MEKSQSIQLMNNRLDYLRNKVERIFQLWLKNHLLEDVIRLIKSAEQGYALAYSTFSRIIKKVCAARLPRLGNVLTLPQSAQRIHRTSPLNVCNALDAFVHR